METLFLVRHTKRQLHRIYYKNKTRKTSAFLANKRQRAQEKAKRMNLFEMHESLIKAVNDTIILRSRKTIIRREIALRRICYNFLRLFQSKWPTMGPWMTCSNVVLGSELSPLHIWMPSHTTSINILVLFLQSIRLCAQSLQRNKTKCILLKIV